MSISPSTPRRPLSWPEIIEHLSQACTDPEDLYLVGGVVRDALKVRPLHDIDLSTAGSGLNAARQIANALGGAYYPVDPVRETGRAILPTPTGELIVDVATFRGADLLEDLRGRDFTINAMAVPLAAPDLIIDPLGGQADLFDHRVLRQCSPVSISSDPIRALRGVRMCLRFGLRLLPETRVAVRQAAGMLNDSDGNLVQPERIRDEMFKLLGGSRSAPALRLLHSLSLLDRVMPFPLPSIEQLETRFSLVEHTDALLNIVSPRRNDNTAADLLLGVAVMVLDRFRRQLQDHLWQELAAARTRAHLLLIAALTPEVDAAGAAWADYWRLSNVEKRILDGIFASQQLGFPPEGWDTDRDRSIYRYFKAARDSGVEGVILALAAYVTSQGTSIDPERWGTLLDDAASPLLDGFFRRHQQVVAPPPLLTGTELIDALNLSPGPKIGRILNLLVEEQAAGTIQSKKEALQFAKRLSQPDPPE